MTNKVMADHSLFAWKKISRRFFFIEDSNGVTSKDQDAMLNRWREEYFSDLLNPVHTTTTLIHEELVREDIQITKQVGLQLSNH